MIPLPLQEIHLWLTYPDEVPTLLEKQYRSLLSPAERDEEQRYRFQADRRRFLITRALARTVLSRYAPIAPQEWSFVKDPFGRPQVTNTTPAGWLPVFNISHTRELIVLGISRNRALGVDVENVHNRRVPPGLAERVFPAQEASVLTATNKARRQAEFFEYWTLKESYIKARGMGLSLPLDQLTFCLREAQSIEVRFAPVLRDDPQRWYFWQFRPKRHYLIATCAANTTPERPAMRGRVTVPLGPERPLDVRFARLSRVGAAAGKPDGPTADAASSSID